MYESIVFCSACTMSFEGSSCSLAHLLVSFLYDSVCDMEKIGKWPIFSVRYMSSHVRLSVVCLSSVVCNVRSPYSGYWNFRQCFHALWYLGHPWPLEKILRRSSQGNPFVVGLNPRGVAKYSDFEPLGGYISETMQDIIYVCINH